MTAARSSDVIGRLLSAESRATRSFTKTKPAMLSRLPEYTGKREYSCSRNSARRSPMLASSRMATMSGRGVITSRTSESPKSTMFCSSRRSSPAINPSCSAVSMNALAASFASSAVSSAAGCSDARRLFATDRAIQRVNGDNSFAIGIEGRQQQFQHPFGIAADDEQRKEQLEHDRERRDGDDDQRRGGERLRPRSPPPAARWSPRWPARAAPGPGRTAGPDRRDIR